MDKDFSVWIDELVARTDLVNVISRYLPLNRRGSNYWGCCPFHHEKTPSFAVNAEKQLYHCFGCKESGNVITFIKKMENVEFMDAVKILAAEAKMEIPRFERTQEVATAEKKDRLLSLLREAARHYYDNLSHARAAAAVEYLAKRGIPDSLVKKFGLGFSIDGDEIIGFLKSKGYTLTEMKEAGIAAQKGDNYYDVYYNRLIFPIINAMGEVIGFGGRTLQPNPDFAKYRNTSQTVVFDKSKAVYAINLLKKKRRNEKIEYVIMTEGYMDVIALHKAGFDTAVASMGTALTWAQAKQIKNYCERIYISYDGDAAGQKATMRGLDILVQAGLSVRVVRMPDGLDPDDVIKTKGREFYMDLLRQAQTLPAFKIDTLTKDYDLSDPEEKSRFAVEAIKVIKALENPVEREDYLKTVQRLTGYSKEVLYAQADITVTEPPAEPKPYAIAAEDKPDDKTQDSGKRFVLASLIHDMDYVDYTDDLYLIFDDDLSREIYSYVIDRVRSGTYKSPSSLYTVIPEQYESEISELVNYSFVEGDGKKKYRDCVKTLKIKSLLDEKERLKKSASADVLSKLAEIDKEIKRLKNIKE